MDIYKTLYEKMEQAGILQVIEKQWVKFEAPGMLDLNVELLYGEKSLHKISMAHYFEENGDLVPDPDMVIAINTEEKTAEPLSFQNKFIYQEANNPLLKKELAEFLNMWLNNILASGYTEKPSAGMNL
ncbi:DUF6908 domain-containing protein [Persephonella sp.]